MRRDFNALYLRNYVRGAENYGGRMLRWSKGKFPHSAEGHPADILGAAFFV